MTHTQRTLKYLRDQGLTAGIVERWMPNPKHPAGGVRKDLFGIIDIIAIGPEKTMGVQSCGSDFAEHDRLILGNATSRLWAFPESKRSLILIG